MRKYEEIQTIFDKKFTTTQTLRKFEDIQNITLNP